MAAHYKMIQDVVANDIHWKGECVSAVCRVRWNSSVPAFGSLSMRLLCASANSSPRWVRLEEGVIRVADGRGIGDLDSPTPVHLKIHDCGAFDLELAIGILTLRWRGDRFQDIPMLDLLAFFQAIEAIEAAGLPSNRPSLIMRTKLPCPRTLWALSVTLTNSLDKFRASSI